MALAIAIASSGCVRVLSVVVCREQNNICNHHRIVIQNVEKYKLTFWRVDTFEIADVHDMLPNLSFLI